MATASAKAAGVGLRELALPWSGTSGDVDPIVALAAPATLVLIGEASHGTHEFYDVRGEISKRLIAGHGASAIAVEADCTACTNR